MKKITKILATGVITGALTLGILYNPSAITPKTVFATEEVNEKNTIQVNGQGTIKVKPDIAQVTIGVQTENKDAKIAQNENAEKMDTMIQALKNLGIDESDIQTSNYSIQPQYRYPNQTGERILDNYYVNNTVNITVRDIKKVGNVLDIGVENGANISRGIQFSISNSDEYYQLALKEAVKNAKGKADAMAEVIGVTLSEPMNIAEQTYGEPVVRYAQDMMEAKIAQPEVATPIESGELEIKAMVNVTYGY